MACQLSDIAGAGEVVAKGEAKLSKLALSVKDCAIKLREKKKENKKGEKQLDQHLRDSGKTMRLDLQQMDQESQFWAQQVHSASWMSFVAI